MLTVFNLSNNHNVINTVYKKRVISLKSLQCDDGSAPMIPCIKGQEYNWVSVLSYIRMYVCISVSEKLSNTQTYTHPLGGVKISVGFGRWMDGLLG